MSLLADKLRAQAEKKQKKEEEKTHMSARDVDVFVARIKLLARKRAKAGKRSARYTFDEIRKEICHGRVPAIEEALKIEGFEVHYSAEMPCGFYYCKRRCGTWFGAHAGYEIYW